MAGTEKMFIMVLRNGLPVGYVKSVRQSSLKIQMAQDKMDAKSYTNVTVMKKDLRYLERIQRLAKGNPYEGLTFELMI